MTRRSRYLLITAGFIVFLIFAPLIVFYVRGMSFDFKARKLVSTGILAVRTEPKNVEILLNGKLKRRSAGNIRFLKAGEYQVKIEKTDYRPWEKRLEVRANEVTWAGYPSNKIYLLWSRPPLTEIAKGVLDYSFQNQRLIYLTDQKLVLYNLGGQTSSQNFELPKPVSQITPSPNQQTLVLTSPAKADQAAILVFNQSAGKFYDISNLFSPQTKFKFLDDNQLFALDLGTLYKVNYQENHKTPILTDVLAFTFQDNNLYYVQATSGPASLMVSELPSYEGMELIKALPAFSQGDLIVTYNKEVFLVADRVLYKINTKNQVLAQNLDDWYYDADQANFVFFHAGELSYYQAPAFETNFITRSQSPIANPRLKLPYSYVLYYQGSAIKALETDTRDRQNEYELYQTANLKKFSIDEDMKNLLVLDGDHLKIINIR